MPARRAITGLACVFATCGLTALAGASTSHASPHGGHRARRDLHVTTTGSARSRCTRAVPCTFRRANALAAPGTTIHVAPGRYGRVPVLSRAGAPGARVRWMSDTRWGARLTGPVKLSGAYVDLQGFDVKGGRGNDIVWLAATATRAIGNRVHDLRKSCADPSGGDGIGFDGGAFGWRSRDQEAIRNLVENIGSGPRDGTCRRISGIYPDTPGDKVLNNIVRNAAGDGISSWHAARENTIANNTSVDNGGFGILNGSGGHGAVTANTGTYTVNNIVAGNFKGAIIEANDFPDAVFEPHGNHYYDNLLWANRGGDFIAATDPDEAGTIVADPLFVDPAGGDYHVQAASPAVNTGTSTRAPSRSFTGTRRPQAAGFDRGAYERPAPPTSLRLSAPLGLFGSIYVTDALSRLLCPALLPA